MTKERILEQIRRTTEANSGTPLGSRRFANDTGIREADWLGKFWGRWGDALKEAGFSPNQLRAPYDTRDLLKKYVKLAREVGRMPTANDLRMKDRTDPSYPNQKVYERLGTKSELVQKTLEYCRQGGGLEDVVAMCEAYTPRSQPVSKDKAVDADDIGCVYLAKSGRFYKIGRSSDIGRREYELSIQLPERLTTVHVIRTDDPVGIEGYWHRRFESKRKNGEWFDLDAQDVRAFKRRKFM